MQSKEQMIGELLTNPALTSDWIQAATDVVEQYPENIVLDDLNALSAQQILMMNEFIKYFDNNIELVLAFYHEHNYNETQLQVILQALCKNLTIDKINEVVDEEVPYATMNWLLAAVAEGYDQFEDPIYRNYHPDQLQEVFSGLKDGIEVSDYDRVDMDSKKMQVIRHARCVGLTVEIDEEMKLTIY